MKILEMKNHSRDGTVGHKRTWACVIEEEAPLFVEMETLTAARKGEVRTGWGNQEGLHGNWRNKCGS